MKTRAEDYLQATGLPYTIIRPGGLKDGEPTGNAVLTEDPMAMGIVTRRDLAQLIVAALDDPGDQQENLFRTRQRIFVALGHVGLTGRMRADAGYPEPRWAWYGVGVLMVAYTFSFIDRYVIALLIQPIKQDFDLTDTQIGLLSGLAFAIFYTTLGIPIGRLADRYNRRRIISAGIFVWSLMTGLCGLAQSFWQLFAARVGVGVGEAALSPAAFSLIADSFPVQRIGRALSVYSVGVYFGSGLAFIIGGAVIQLVTNAPDVVLPLIGTCPAVATDFYRCRTAGTADRAVDIHDSRTGPAQSRCRRGRVRACRFATCCVSSGRGAAPTAHILSASRCWHWPLTRSRSGHRRSSAALSISPPVRSRLYPRARSS